MLRGWTSKGKKLRMWRWSDDWMLVQGFASSCMAMALTLRYGLEHLKMLRLMFYGKAGT